ncbi:cupin domain-containing protein [Salinarchaeum sp. Harcht-Bsk1]|uniref:cupin domain-containing protein n=1 Tax=Salinarchaeum sp. Harcht-Bsk1 TaxID=1333523 RepID=UPI00067763B1|nr:cupin domain-containing protein [Salinarchaeum sp. Harcht-Bsk1]
MPADSPVIRDRDSIEYESVDAAEGLQKGVLIDESRGAPTFALRRFTLDSGATVPRHTNDVEHVQYVLAGEYVVGLAGTEGEADLGDGEHRVRPGDSLLIPAGTVHWYRNDGDSTAAFLCGVPNGDDSIELVE